MNVAFIAFPGAGEPAGTRPAPELRISTEDARRRRAEPAPPTAPPACVAGPSGLGRAPRAAAGGPVGTLDLPGAGHGIPGHRARVGDVLRADGAEPDRPADHLPVDGEGAAGRCRQGDPAAQPRPGLVPSEHERALVGAAVLARPSP